MRVRLISQHIAHHAAHSGYDQLAKHVDAEVYQPGLLDRLAARLGHRHLRRFPLAKGAWYSDAAQRRELAICARTTLNPNRTLFHWLYGEDDMRLAPGWRWRWNNRFMATFHQPPELLEKHLPDLSFLRGIDALVVLARSQVGYMSRFVPSDRILLVPHGVATDHWHPAPRVARRPEPTFLFVGSWLRDIETTLATIKRCAALDSPAHFRVVTSSDFASRFEGLPNTAVLTGISDAQLLTEYREAHALFLPLLMSTANNAILESMSCGTGVVTTLTGGTTDYVTSACGTLVPPGDVEAAAKAVGDLCSSPRRIEEMGAAARQRALEFSWHRIGALQNAAYLQTLTTPPPR